MVLMKILSCDCPPSRAKCKQLKVKFKQFSNFFFFCPFRFHHFKMWSKFAEAHRHPCFTTNPASVFLLGPAAVASVLLGPAEVNITGYCIFIFSNILQIEILVIMPWIFHIIATKSTAGKNFFFFYILWEKRCATKAFSSATRWPFSEEHLAFFRWLKTLWWTHIIEYLLLAIWPISLFFAFMQYTGAKLEKVNQNIPLSSWTLHLRSCSHNCEWACTSAPFTNDWNSLTYTCLTIKSDAYEAFVNPEESFREGRLRANYSAFTPIFTNVSWMRPIECKYNLAASTVKNGLMYLNSLNWT